MKGKKSQRNFEELSICFRQPKAGVLGVEGKRELKKRAALGPSLHDYELLNLASLLSAAQVSRTDDRTCIVVDGCRSHDWRTRRVGVTLGHRWRGR
jgi:hypothetical protein